MKEKEPGRKIHSHVENPIDDQLIHLSEQCIDICRDCNITPNHITIFRFIVSIFVFYSLYNSCDILFPMFGFGLCYFLDCLDGHLARTTKQVTVLGDYLDHIADLFVAVMFVIYIFYKKYELKQEIILLFFIMSYFTLVHLSLQQKTYYENEHSEATLSEKSEDFLENEHSEATLSEKSAIQNEPELLDHFHKIHNFDPENITWTRFFGLGTLNTFMMLLIYWIQSHCL